MKVEHIASRTLTYFQKVTKRRRRGFDGDRAKWASLVQEQGHASGSSLHLHWLVSWASVPYLSRITWGDLKTVKASRTPRSFWCEQSKWGWHWFLTLPGDSHGQSGLRITTAKLITRYPPSWFTKLCSSKPFGNSYIGWWHSHTASILEHFHHLKETSAAFHPLLSSQPLATTHLLSLWICLFWTFHVNQII